MRSLRLITDATAEPVSLADIKVHLGLSTVTTTQDSLLTGLIKGARKHGENYMKRCCLPQAWQLKLDAFEDEIILPRAPLSSASSDVVITYLDGASGNSTTLATSCYTVDMDSEPGRITLAYNQTWPNVYPVDNAVTINFKAGYPLDISSVDTCPEEIETWIKMRVGALYENREHLSDRQAQELPRSFMDGLLDEYILIEVAP